LFQMGSAPVLRPTAKQYLFWSDLPLYAESGRPPQYHQTIRFFLRDPALRARRTKVTIRFRQIAMRNPHASGEYRQNPFVPRGWMTYLLNGKAVAANHIRVRRQPEGRIESGFVLGKHALVMLEVSVGSLKVGENQLAFHVPRSPHDRDPYIYIYQLEVDITPRR